MNKEPIGLYIFRFVMGLGLFAFMAMLYWSSVLVEHDLKILHDDMDDLKNEIFELQNRPQPSCIIKENPQVTATTNRPHINPKLPNLLEPDPFYEKTLPNMLGDNFTPRGTLHSATIGKPENLHPFSGWRDVNNWIGLCTSTSATLKFGKYETLTPDMAIKMEERPRQDAPGKEFWIHLRDDVTWQPLQQKLFSSGVKLAAHFLRKHPVTAHDFKFFFDVLMNPYNQETGAVSSRIYLDDIDAVEVLDDLTFVVKWRAEEVLEEDGTIVPKVKYVAKFSTAQMLRPLASFVYKYFADGTKIVEDDTDPDTYRTNSVFAQNFAQHWAKNIIPSCGAWIFEGKTDRQIQFRRNPDHYNPYDALITHRETLFRNSTDTIWQDFKTEKLETHGLLPDQLIEYDEFMNSDLYKKQKANGRAIHRLDYIGRSYNYIGWNLATPFFKSKKVRQAMTMAIDRKRIIDHYLNGMGIEIAGTFARFSPAYNEKVTPWPFNLNRARELLEEEGWYDSDGDGVIDKMINGTRIPFRFALTYYVKNPTTKAISEYVATALREIGVDCQLTGVDIADLSAAFDSKNFDAIYLGWALGTPPEDPGQLWHSSGAKEQGSSNAIGFVNAEVDTIIDKLHYEEDRSDRIKLYHRFGEIIHDEAPYTFLFTGKTTLLYREFVENVFIPAERQDLIPGANIDSPQSAIFWLSNQGR